MQFLPSSSAATHGIDSSLARSNYQSRIWVQDFDLTFLTDYYILPSPQRSKWCQVSTYWCLRSGGIWYPPKSWDSVPIRSPSFASLQTLPSFSSKKHEQKVVWSITWKINLNKTIKKTHRHIILKPKLPNWIHAIHSYLNSQTNCSNP